MSPHAASGEIGVRARAQACRRFLLRRGTLAALLLGVAGAGLVLPAAFVLGPTGGWTPGSPVPLLLLVLALLLGLGVAGWFLRGAWLRARMEPLVETMEGVAGLPRGRLRAQLELEEERAPPGEENPVGAALVARGGELLRAPLQRTPAELAGPRGREADRLLRLGAGVAGGMAALALLLLLASPERSLASWAGLVHPLGVLHPEPLPPLVVEPGDAEVARGDSVELRVQAPGRRSLTLHEEAAGAVPTARVIPVVEGEARGWSHPVEGRTRYRVVGDDGASSPDFVLEPRDPLLLEDFRLELRYPPWTGLAPESRGHLPGTLTLPAGTTLVFSGRMAGDGVALSLVEASEPGEGAEGMSGGRVLAPFAWVEDRLEARWTPVRSTRVRWALERPVPEGQRLPPELAVELLPDLPPRVSLAGPPNGSELPGSGRLALLLEAEDDWGLDWVELEVEVHAGDASPRTLRDRTPARGSTRVALGPVIETAPWGAPGGSRVRVRALAADLGAGPGVGTSPWMEYRLPGTEALRRDTRERVETAARTVEELAERALREQARTEEALRDAVAAGAATPAGGSEPGSGGSAGDAAAAEVAGLLAALEGQASLLAELDALRESLASGGEGLGRGSADDALRQLLDGLDRAFEARAGGAGREALDREVQEALGALEALQSGRSTLTTEEQAALLTQAAERAEELRERLEGLRAELREAAFRSGLAGLQEETGALAREQEAVAREPETASAETQAALEARAAEALAELERLQAVAAERSASDAGAEAALARAGEAMEEARSAMARAGEAMEMAQEAQGTGGAEAARDAAQEAAAEAAEAAERARAAVEEAARADEEARAVLYRDVLSGLAVQALGLGRQALEIPADGARVAAVAALQEGTLALARESQTLAPLLGDAVREVSRGLGRALAALEGASARDDSGEAVQAALQGVARAALEALAREGGGTAEGGSGSEAASLAEALEELASLQDALNQDAAGAAGGTMPQPGMGDMDGNLAARQEAVAQGLGELARHPGGDRIPGSLESLAREAEELARALEGVAAGERPAAELLDRQDRLLDRLLDAGRSLERDGPTEERRGTPALPVLDRPFVPALPDGLLSGARIPLPDARALEGLTPGERRLVLEYFRRLGGTP